jgi:hypothetical protein
MSAHTVTVTQLDNTHIDGLAEEDYVDEVKYTIEHCPGGNCTVWWECAKDEYRNHEHDDCDEYDAHGEEHQCIDGMWMIESKDCAAVTTDSGHDGMQEEAENAGLGTHQFRGRLLG